MEEKTKLDLYIYLLVWEVKGSLLELDEKADSSPEDIARLAGKLQALEDVQKFISAK